MKSINNYYSGTSGLLLPVPNKLYYPEEFQHKSRLCYYASFTNSIEVNSSFYKIPLASTVAKWAANVNSTFRFTFKLFKEITHNKDLAFDSKLISHFFHVISAVKEKKACLLVQFPPSVRINYLSQLQFLMSVLRDNDRDKEWKIALEFRHASLYVEEIFELLENYDLGMVIHDKIPAISPILDTELDFVYLRFHGPNGNYCGSYDDEVLIDYANYINDWLAKNKKVFIYFNNTMGGAFQNMNTLRQMVNRLSSFNF